jgi:hypothetical protein
MLASRCCCRLRAVLASAGASGIACSKMESAIARGDHAAYRALVAPAVPPERADAFAADTVSAGVTRAVLRARDRAPMPDPVGGAFRLVVEIFVEMGDHARVWTLRVNVERQPPAGPGAPASDTWLITAQDRLTSIDGLYRLALDPATQLEAANLVVTSEDVELTMPRGNVFVARAGTETTALVLGMGCSALPRSPSRSVAR